MSEDRTEERVRRRLRELRTRRGLTLADVAERAGMAPSTVSRLESGARRLAVDHLPHLARALGVSTDELLAEGRAPDPRVRASAQRRDGMVFWPLTRQGPAAGLHAFKVAIEAGRRAPEARTHEGYEWLYVLSGRLALHLDGEELVLGPGEAAEFSTWRPHALGAHDGPVELLVIFGAHGERVHLRADDRGEDDEDDD